MTTIPFQNYLIYVLFNYMYLFLDSCRKELRKVPLGNKMKTFYNQ